MDDNVSPEALLSGHRKMRGPVQVVPFEAEGGSAPAVFGVGDRFVYRPNERVRGW